MTPPPEPVEAPKLCPLSSDGAHILDQRTERCVYCRRSAESVLEQERSQLTPTPGSGDRPIQAGDWVECVGDYPVKAEVKQGCRYRVAFTEVNSFGEPCLRVSPAGLRISTAMFKRVDGPHPASAMAPAAPPLPMQPATAIQSPSTCSECKAPAALKDSGQCAYCHQSTYGGERKRADLDDDVRYAATGNPRNVAARKRLAAIERRERPRVTADSIAFAKPHVWEEFE